MIKTYENIDLHEMYIEITIDEKYICNKLWSLVKLLNLEA